MAINLTYLHVYIPLTAYASSSSPDKHVFHLWEHSVSVSGHLLLLTSSYVKNDVAMLGATLTNPRQPMLPRHIITYAGSARALYRGQPRPPCGECFVARLERRCT